MRNVERRNDKKEEGRKAKTNNAPLDSFWVPVQNQWIDPMQHPTPHIYNVRSLEMDIPNYP